MITECEKLKKIFKVSRYHMYSLESQTNRFEYGAQ